MMKQLGPAFVLSCLGLPANTSALRTLSLSATQANSLSAALVDDAKGAIYSAVISMADALSGLQRGYFSWATVKLYYVCFYLAKAAVARRGYCVFYFQRSPYYLQAMPGVSPKSQGGNSHTVVTKLYKSFVPDGVINSQPLDGIHAFDWIATRREDVNYREIRFLDPIVPSWFSNIDAYGVRRVIRDYLSDPSLYAFDVAHAMVALPLAAMQEEARSTLKFVGLGLAPDDAAILKGLFADRSGPIQNLGFL